MTIAKFINNSLIALATLAFGMQFMIAFTTVNIAAASIVFASTLITLFYFRWSKALETHPLSSFAIFGFCVTSQFGALLAQSATWLPISKNLYQPILTFSLLAMYQGIALSANALYRIITASSSNKPGMLRQLLGSLGIYATPTVSQLWFFGVFGIFSLLLSYISPVANGLSFLAWAPFLIPIYVQQIGPSYCNVKKNYILLIFHASVIAVMAMAFNARSMMLSGIATVCLLFLLIGMRSKKTITSKMLMRFGLVGLFGWALSWPASNMVTAMVMARQDKFKVPITQMVTKTIDNFLDPEKIEAFTKLAKLKELRSNYNENYVTNPIMARFVITKFHDNAIYFGGRISEKDSEVVWKYTGDFFWATLPQPWLDALKIDVDKDKLYFSMGDLLVNLAVGQPLGGEKTGSIFGQGLVMFGSFFPVVYFFMCLILFAAIDMFYMRTAQGVAVLSLIGMLSIWSNFLFGITADSLHHLFNNVARGVVQPVILYAIVLVMAKIYLRIHSSFFRSKTAARTDFIAP